MNLHESLSTPTCRAALLARRPGHPALVLDQDGPFVPVRDEPFVPVRDETFAPVRDEPFAPVQDGPFVPARRPGNSRPAEVARRILATTWQSWRQPVPPGRTLTIVAGGQA